MTSNKKNRDKNDKNDQKDLREGHYYMKVAFFFTKNQVEPIKK
jgi:hypothetical protein